METSGQRCVKNTSEIEMVGFVDGLDVGIKGREESRLTPKVWAQAMGGQ